VAIGVLVICVYRAEFASVASRLEALVRAAGGWGPLVFVGVYAAAMCALVPSAPLTVLGAVLFGPYKGFALVWVAGVLGSAGCFALARRVGRNFAVRHAGSRFRALDAVVERRGFSAVLLLRLANIPFTPASFGLGLTAVRFRDYLLGTALGIVPGCLAVTYAVGMARDGLSGRSAHALTTGLGAGALLVGVFAVSLGYARRKLRARGASPGGADGP
jgi:uncharacterized membrane protein YdjX (TVP38/TMEM64 family)